MMQRFAPEFMCVIVQHDGLLKGVLMVRWLAGSLRDWVLQLGRRFLATA